MAAELFRQDAEDDDESSGDSKESSKRIDPKKIPQLPILPASREQVSLPQEPKRIAELLPNIFEADKPKTEESPEADAENAPNQAVEGSENSEATPGADLEPAGLPEAESNNDIFDMSEDTIHLRQPRPEQPSQAEANLPGSSEEVEPAEPTLQPAAASGPASPRPVPAAENTPTHVESKEPAPAYSRPPAARQPYNAPAAGSESANRYTPNISPSVTPERLKSEVRDLKGETAEARRRNMLLIMVAGATTAILLKNYFDTKAKAVEVGLDLVKDQLSSMLQKNEQNAARRPPQAAERGPVAGQHVEAAPPAQEAQEQIFDTEGNQIVLEPGWHVERSTGGYSVVLDEHNHVVHNVIHYGEAFRRDKKREQLDDDVFAAVDGVATSNSPMDNILRQLGTPATQQTTARPPTRAPDQSQPVDLNHRLSGPRNHLASTVASPWLWTAIAVLIIVYFIAALA